MSRSENCLGRVKMRTLGTLWSEVNNGGYMSSVQVLYQLGTRKQLAPSQQDILAAFSLHFPRNVHVFPTESIIVMYSSTVLYLSRVATARPLPSAPCKYQNAVTWSGLDDHLLRLLPLLISLKMALMDLLAAPTSRDPCTSMRLYVRLLILSSCDGYDDLFQLTRLNGPCHRVSCC